jgi:adenine-specific DNA methylase
LVSNQDFFKITRNTNDFRSPQEVINGWFIESNIDSNTKFSSLKKLLSLFEMEDELSVKYSIGSENESDSSRFNVRKRYWQQLLPLLNNTALFSNVNASKEYWLSTGAGITGVAYTLIATKSFVRIDLAIVTSSKETNKMYFKKLQRNKEAIEQSFGSDLVWVELPENKMSLIKIVEEGVNIFNESDWPKMNEFIVTNLPRFETAFSPFIKNLK